VLSVKVPVIGIPGWPWKKRVLKQALDHPRIERLKIDQFCYECTRHFELLQMFDRDDDHYQQSRYFRYQIETKKSPKDTLKKIKAFKALYAQIQKEGLRVPPVVTTDGCRIDGSHRLAIALHLKHTEADINVAAYEDFMSPTECENIRNQVSLYRREVYGFTN